MDTLQPILESSNPLLVNEDSSSSKDENDQSGEHLGGGIPLKYLKSSLVRENYRLVCQHLFDH
jgi:hypothetical protein